MMATVSVGSLSNHVKSWCSCQCKVKGMEFLWLGLCIVTRRMPSDGKVADAFVRGGGGVSVGIFGDGVWMLRELVLSLRCIGR